MTELAVLVPVLNRPENVAPLVESFLEGCPEDSILCFYVSNGDDEELKAVQAWDIPSVHYWIVGEDLSSWPSKINMGVNRPHGQGAADWYLCAADDIRFTPGWWEATHELRSNPAIGVIGTNDSHNGTGNPRVSAGDHTCHPLIRSSYIQTQGTVDTPGQAVHNGYSHWYVDDELVITAKSRTAWGFCKEAVIEHLHPYWDPTIPWDATYAQGEVNAAADRDLFAARMREFFYPELPW